MEPRVYFFYLTIESFRKYLLLSFVEVLSYNNRD